MLHVFQQLLYLQMIRMTVEYAVDNAITVFWCWACSFFFSTLITIIAVLLHWLFLSGNIFDEKMTIDNETIMSSK